MTTRSPRSRCQSKRLLTSARRWRARCASGELVRRPRSSRRRAAGQDPLEQELLGPVGVGSPTRAAWASRGARAAVAEKTVPDAGHGDQEVEARCRRRSACRRSRRRPHRPSGPPPGLGVSRLGRVRRVDPLAPRRPPAKPGRAGGGIGRGQAVQAEPVLGPHGLGHRTDPTGPAPTGGRCAGRSGGARPVRGPRPPPASRAVPGGNDPVDQTHGQGLLGTHLATGQDEVEGPALADQPGEPDRPAVDQGHAEPPAEHAEGGVLPRPPADRTRGPAPGRRPRRSPRRRR